MKTAQADLTTGPLGKKIFRFSIPLIFSNLLQVLFNMADVAVVGRFAGSTALGAVGSTTIFVSLFTGFLIGLSGGVNVLVAHHFGADDQKNLSDTVHSAALTCAAAGLVLLGIGCGFAGGILRALHTKPELMDGAVLYLRITMLGILGNMGYNFNAGLLRGIGNSSSSLLLLFISCAANVVLDLVLTGALGLGIGGVAAATAIALFLSWICSIFYIRRRCTELALPVLPCGFDAGALRQIVRIGLPLGLNSALYSIGHVFLQVLYNLQGSVFVAGCSVAGKVGGLANITVTSLSQATSVFAGQNLGAQSYSRLRRGGWLLPAASGLLSLAGGLLMAACCRPLLLLFTQDEAVLAFAVRYIRVVLPFQWCYAAFNAIMSFANGMGEIRYSTIVNIILLWGVRIPASYLLAWLGYGGYAMAGVSLSFVVGLLAMLFYYKSHAWADICARAEAQEAAK